MDNADFDSLRLGFNDKRKKTKTSQSKIPMGDPADINGYVGPWGNNLTDSFKTSSGPSEV